MSVSFLGLLVTFLALAAEAGAQDGYLQKNRSVWQEEVLMTFTVYFSDYAKHHNGHFPGNWVELEQAYDQKSMWTSEKLREKTVSRFVFAPDMKGDIMTDRGLAKDLDLLMIETISSRRGSDAGGALGRWGIWRTATGVMLVEWFSAAELATFTRWKDVEALFASAKTKEPPEEANPQHRRNDPPANRVDGANANQVPNDPVASGVAAPGKPNIWPYLICAALLLIFLVKYALTRGRK